MSDKLTIYYSVENCGDGSAYPKLFDTEKLAEWHQNHLDECWGEPCIGQIIIEGNNLRCEKLETKEGYYLHLLLEGYENDNEVNMFVAEFFHDGLPKFTVEIIKPKYYGIFVEKRLVYKQFAHPEKKANNEGVEKLIEKVNC